MTDSTSVLVTIRIKNADLQILASALPSKGLNKKGVFSPGLVIRHIVSFAVEDLISI